jgi:hypothetical protein
MEKSTLPGKTDRIHRLMLPTYGKPPYEMTESGYTVRHIWRLWSEMLTGLQGENLGPIIYTMI